MNYYWGDCPRCACRVTIHFTDYPERLSGSVRRWSADRSINDGRRLEIPRAEVAADGSFRAPCVCGEILVIAAAAIERATTERPVGSGLKV